MLHSLKSKRFFSKKQYFLHKFLILFTYLNTLLLSSSFATNSILEDLEKTIASHLINKRIDSARESTFDFIREFDQYTRNIKNLAQDEKWDEIIVLAQNRHYQFLDILISYGILIEHHYSNTCLLCEAFQTKAKTLTKTHAEQYYQQAIVLYTDYLENFEHFKVKKINDIMFIYSSKETMNYELGTIYIDLFFTLSNPDFQLDLSSYLLKATACFTRAIDNNKKMQQFKIEYFNNIDDFKMIRSIYYAYKSKLFYSYLGLMAYASEPRLIDLYFEKAQSILHDLKENRTLYRSAKQGLEIMARERQAKNFIRNTEYINDAMRYILITKLRTEIVDTKSQQKKLQQKNEKIDIRYDIFNFFTQFIFLNLTSEYSQALHVLKEIENNTWNYLQLENINNDQNQYFKKSRLKKIYHYLLDLKPTLFDGEKIINCFLENGMVEEALLRVQVFKLLTDDQSSAQSTHYYQIWIAYLKSLMGDYQEWFNLEQQVKQIQQSNKARKKSKKHITHIQNIQANLEQRKTENEQNKQILVEKNREIEHLKSIRKLTLSYTEQPSSVVDYSTVSNHQQRIEKLERHEQHLKQREQTKEWIHKQTIIDNPNQTLPVSSNNFQESSTTSTSSSLSTLPLRLTGLAQRVDQEIIDNTWHFDRSDLRHYFEALGCRYQSGKGSHDKINLLSVTHVMYNEQFITFVAEEGGVLTLPKWHDKVPYHLREQINLARKKIIKSIITQNI